MNSNDRINGLVAETSGKPVANQCFIKGEDGHNYFAHIGDLEANEKILYKLLEGKELDPQLDKAQTFLEQEKINFIPVHNTLIDGKGRAISIRKIKQ